MVLCRLVVEAEAIGEPTVVDVREGEGFGSAEDAGADERIGDRLLVGPVLLVLGVAPTERRVELVSEVDVALRVRGVAVDRLCDVLIGCVLLLPAIGRQEGVAAVSKCDEHR